MSYFSTFPYIQYEFPDGVVRLIKNISIRPSVIDEFFGVYSNFDTYDIKDGETPETLAYDFYGDVNLHWAIMLVNKRFNIYKDWPKTTASFEDYMRQKYGTALNNKKVPVVLDDVQYQRVVEFVGVPDSEWTDRINLNDSEFITLRPHHFEDANKVEYTYDVAVIDSDFEFNAFGLIQEKPVNLKPVSIYDHEAKLNDIKRSIIIPNFESIQQMRNELNNIVNE